jgi:hypothetical protein
MTYISKNISLEELDKQLLFEKSMKKFYSFSGSLIVVFFIIFSIISLYLNYSVNTIFGVFIFIISNAILFIIFRLVELAKIKSVKKRYHLTTDIIDLDRLKENVVEDLRFFCSNHLKISELDKSIFKTYEIEKILKLKAEIKPLIDVYERLDFPKLDNQTNFYLLKFYNALDYIKRNPEKHNYFINESVEWVFDVQENKESLVINENQSDEVIIEIEPLINETDNLEEKTTITEFENLDDSESKNLDIERDKTNFPVTDLQKFEILSNPSADVLNEKSKVARLIDWEKIGIYKSMIGLMGEELVFELEKNKLLESGKNDLALKVKHVSVDYGDGLGYDIISYDENGNEMYIEVKSSIGELNANIYFSQNELEVMNDIGEQYHVYRVYKLDIDNRTFEIEKYNGSSAIFERFNFIPDSFTLKRKSNEEGEFLS